MLQKAAYNASKSNDKPNLSYAQETPAMRINKSAPPRCLPATNAEAVPWKNELGFTLQTLIVTAVLVLVAVGASIGLVAITSSSSDDFEDAGQTGVETRCATNEVKDPELEARGVKGVNQTFREIEADTIGCNPVCATWEYYAPGRAAAGIGGPEGNGGIFSSNEGCFAPCYWAANEGTYTPEDIPSAYYVVQHEGSSLSWDDSNRAPGVTEVRLGVVYTQWRYDSSGARIGSSAPPDQIENNGQKRIQLLQNGRQSKVEIAGTQPIGAYTGKPLWRKFYTGVNERHRLGDFDISYFWEVRADPKEEKCYIIDTSFDDYIVCTSEQARCRDSNYYAVRGWVW